MIQFCGLKPCGRENGNPDPAASPLEVGVACPALGSAAAGTDADVAGWVGRTGLDVGNAVVVDGPFQVGGVAVGLAFVVGLTGTYVGAGGLLSAVADALLGAVGCGCTARAVC